MHTKLELSIALIFALWPALTPSAASACSGFACGGTQVAPAGGVVPANLTGFYTKSGQDDQGGALSLVRTDTGAAVALDNNAVPVQNLLPGTSYRLTSSWSASGRCPAKSTTTTFTAGPEAALRAAKRARTCR
jgi:hypothetical protein